ncbi:MAG TPA: TetR/AcrR family transcriptional regulator [Lachnospiraceae bacterium]|nr:TetR/AcrR family transcriptional regulator [Lachnospiraceae bacterium]
MNNKPEDRRVRRTKKLLKSGFASLIKEKEFKDIRVKDITDLVDLNRGTFYLHYNDTYDLLEKIENEVLDDFQTMIDTYCPQMEGNSMLPVIAPIVDYIVDNLDICRVLFQNKTSNDFWEKFQQLIHNNGVSIIRMKFSDYNQEYLDYFFSFITSGILGLIKEWFDTEMQLPKNELVLVSDKLISATAASIFQQKL